MTDLKVGTTIGGDRARRRTCDGLHRPAGVWMAGRPERWGCHLALAIGPTASKRGDP